MNILVINGPNLNMLGVRDPNLYGNTNYSELVKLIKNHCKQKSIKVKCLHRYIITLFLPHFNNYS